MLKNYFTTAWRNLRGNKVFSLLNILGLAAGMAVALLIGIWVHNEYSYNKFLPGYEQLYQLKLNAKNNGEINTFGSSSLALADGLRAEIPEIEHVAECDWFWPHVLMAGDTKLYLNGGQIEGGFLKMFPYPLLDGQAGTALKDPYSIVLTESTAKALFGNKNAMDRMVRFDNQHDLKVTGILKDLPANSSLQFQFLVPFSYYEQTSDWVKAERRAGWRENSFQAFVQLKPGISYGQVEAKIKGICKRHDAASNLEVILQPVKDWHLLTDFKNGKAVGGFIDYVHMFSIIGILVLLIACINFINLTTARSVKRAREVGVRKTLGSGRGQLILQFLAESFLITLIAFLLCLLLAQLSLPAFNRLTGSQLAIPFSSPSFWGIMLGSVIITALLAGSRPAFYLSSFRPVKVLKGRLQIGKGADLPRKVLVVLQLSCSIALIISTLTIYRQIEYARNRPTGYHLNRLMCTDMNSDLSSHYPALRNELMNSGLTESVSISSSPITEIYWHSGVDDWPGKKPGETVNIGTLIVADDYFRTMGMEFRSGRDFSLASDTMNIILNEAAVRRMRLQQPLNQAITWQSKQCKIIGVVKDALMGSPFSAADPTIFRYGPRGSLFNYLVYRLSPGVGVQDALSRLGVVFNKYNPAYPYRYQFADESYAAKFNFETLVGRLAGIFAGLAIFISCLGLFGLAASMAEQRTREIGIRKVLGASVSRLWLLLSGEFIVLVGVGWVVASPLAYYFLYNWLQKYSYRIGIGVGIFILAALLAMTITLVTVSFQAIRAAIASPVKSLRAE
ncbi:MAG TPA: ABC transporter permease [Puia sp.]|nr:ABC transporter permease [Puia sp.]